MISLSLVTIFCFLTGADKPYGPSTTSHLSSSADVFGEGTKMECACHDEKDGGKGVMTGSSKDWWSSKCLDLDP